MSDVSDDEHIDHAKLQQRYLIHYDTEMGPRFGIDVWSTLHQAQADADSFRRDGYPARVVKLTVHDGQPVAQWTDSRLINPTDQRTVMDDLRREYADWYVREQLARREAKQMHDGRVAMATLENLGFGQHWFQGRGVDLSEEAVDELCCVADWLVGEAEYHRMHAEALLRTYGQEVL